MRIRPLFIVFALSIFILGCSDADKHKITFERPEKITFPDLSNIDYERPDISPYVPSETVDNRSSIQVDPGADQLQAIINNAAPGSTIVLKSGTHTETNTLVINHALSITGEEGAELSLGGGIGLLVTDADDTKISDLTITTPGTSILGLAIEYSDKVTVEDCNMTGFYASIILEEADRAVIQRNTIVGTFTDGLGITVMNGKKATVNRNETSGNVFGIWACDEDGKCYENSTHDNLIGIILCNVPEGNLSAFFPGGTGGSLTPGTNWRVKKNNSYDNVWGYLVIDGAEDNQMVNNTGENNLFVDIELAGLTENLFPVITPTTLNNRIHAGDLSYIDCGENNTVYQGIMADVPCSE